MQSWARIGETEESPKYQESLSTRREVWVNTNLLSDVEINVQILRFWTLSIVLSLSKTPSSLFFKITFRGLDSVSVIR
jgi:hypothetical protein